MKILPLFLLSTTYNKQSTISYSFLLLLLELILFCDAKSKLSNYQSLLCADVHCNEPIADGITTIKYPSPDHNLLSFKKDLNVKIFGKTDDRIYYFAEVNKKRGFVPAKLIKETTVHFDEHKLENVKFNFDEYEKQSSSLKQSNLNFNNINNNVNEQNNNNSIISSSINPISNDESESDHLKQHSTATPFVYSPKVTVIDGTTINEELLDDITATVSPTFVQQPVTKTATIEANFSNIINELDQSTVGENIDESELNKDHGSLLKQLSEPIVVENDVTATTTTSSPEDLIDDVTIVGEESEENETLNVQETVGDQILKNDDIEQKNEESVAIKDENINNSTLSIDESVKKDEKIDQNVKEHDDLSDDQSKEQKSDENLLTEKEPLKIEKTENVEITENQNDTQMDAENTIDEMKNDDLSKQQQQQKENIDNHLLNDNNKSSATDDKVVVTNDDFADSSKNDNNIEQPPQQQQQQPVSKSTIDDVDINSIKQANSVKDIDLSSEKIAENSDQHSIHSSVSTEQQNTDTKSPLEVVNHSQTVHHQVHHSPTYQSQQQSNPHTVTDKPDTAKPDQPASSPFLNHQHHSKNIRKTHGEQLSNQQDLPSAPPPPPQQQSIDNSIKIDAPQPIKHPHHLRSKLIKRSAVDSELNNPVDHNEAPKPLNKPPQQQQQQMNIVDPSPASNELNLNPIKQQTIASDDNSEQQQQQQYHQSNFHAEGSVLNSKHKSFIEPKNNIPQPQPPLPAPSPTPVDNSIISESVLVNPITHSEQEHSQLPVYNNNNIIKRKLLAERVGFVSVIMEIIPDEVELFFESFNISLHAIIFTSIVAFFWCLMKIFIYFISSSKKVRELQDTICQTQRKLYYFEAEKDKIKEEYQLSREESSNLKDNLHRNEKRRYQLEQENEKLKNEIFNLKKDNSLLKLQADCNPIMTAKLNEITEQLDRYKQENDELNIKIDELQAQIEKHLVTIKDQEKSARSDKEEIDNLNNRLIKLNDEIEKQNETMKELEQQYQIVQTDNGDLKEIQYKLNEELKEIKDDLLSSQEKCKNYEIENKELEMKLKELNLKLETSMSELESKNIEIQSMQTLLNKLNKMNIKENSVQRSRRSTMEMNSNGDYENINGDNDNNQDSLNNSNDEQPIGDDTICLQDVIQLQLRLTQMETEKDQYKAKYETLQKQLNELNDEIESIKKLNEKLKQDAADAMQEKFKAITELEVLTRYYKEKELEYAKDIGVHRVKQEQQSEDVESLSSKLAVTEEENSILKSQVKSIKKELEETERRYKSELNRLEKSSHENWIAARSAERKLEETKAEASALRQTLSQSVKSPPPADMSFGGYLDDTASSVSSLPEVLNSSLPVPPPPPPPFPFPSLFGSTIAPPPLPPMPPMPVPGNLFDMNEQPNVVAAAVTNPYWSVTSAAPTTVPTQQQVPNVHQTQSSISSNTSNTYAFEPTKNVPQVTTADLTMTYPQINPLLQSSGQQSQQQPPPQQSQHYGSTSNINVQSSQPLPSNQNIQQQSYDQSYGGHYHEQQQQQYNSSQLDLTRNTYSPAMSQRSTHTPSSRHPNTMNYDMQRATPASMNQFNNNNQYGMPAQPQPPLHHHQQQQQQPSNVSNQNPFSVNYSANVNNNSGGYNPQQQQHSQTQSTLDYYNNSNSHNLNNHKGQFYNHNNNNNGQQQQQQYQTVIDSNNSNHHHQQQQYGSITTTTTTTMVPSQSFEYSHHQQQQMQQQQQQPHSRPQSVHNQMV